MNKRERILAVLVGLSLLALAAFFGARKVNDAIRARQQQIAAAEKAVRDKTQILRLSHEPADRMEDYQRRSLPSDLEQARSLYQTWLLNLVKDAGFEDTQVSVLPTRSEKGIYNVVGILGQRPRQPAQAGVLPASFLFRGFAAPRAAIACETRAGHQAAGSGGGHRRRLLARRPTARTS